jgi:hypothetical protein
VDEAADSVMETTATDGSTMYPRATLLIGHPPAQRPALRRPIAIIIGPLP